MLFKEEKRKNGKVKERMNTRLSSDNNVDEFFSELYGFIPKIKMITNVQI